MRTLVEPVAGKNYRAKQAFNEAKQWNRCVTKYGWLLAIVAIAITYQFLGRDGWRIYAVMMGTPLFFYFMHYLLGLLTYIENQRWTFDEESIQIKGAYRNGKARWKDLERFEDEAITDLPNCRSIAVKFTNLTAQRIVVPESSEELLPLRQLLRQANAAQQVDAGNPV